MFMCCEVESYKVVSPLDFQVVSLGREQKKSFRDFRIRWTGAKSSVGLD